MNLPVRKRLLDVSLVLFTIPIWLPVFLFCILMQAVFEGRPIFYRSMRIVQAGRQAQTWKFRTMVRDAARMYNRDTVPVSGQRFLNTPIDSPLYTRTGRFIERFQFTELPQVFQVLSGTMTIVGSRPLPENVVNSLLEVFPNAQERFSTPCGLTGIVQLVGREELPDADRLALEICYCKAVLERYAMRLDLMILVYTILIQSRLMNQLRIDDAYSFIARFTPGPSERTTGVQTKENSTVNLVRKRRLP